MITIAFFVLSVVFYTLSQVAIHRGYSEKSDPNGFWGINSWTRKYKYPETAPDNWYYRLFNIKYKERFPLSATLFVTLTDGYHLSQALFKLFLSAAIGFYGIWWHGVAAWIVFGIVFTLVYRFAR